MIQEVMKNFKVVKQVKFIVTENGANIYNGVKMMHLEFVDIELEIVDMKDNAIISIGNMLGVLIVEDVDENGNIIV